MAYATALDIISKAAAEMGLGEVTDVYGSGAELIIQLRTLLESVGQELEREHRWTHLHREHTFTTVLNTSVYALPADFREMLPQTGWNRSSRFPLGGPLSPSEWQMMKSFGVASTFNVFLRFERGSIYIMPDTSTPGDIDIAFEYMTTYWVRATLSASPDKAAPTVDTDVIYFDPLLVKRALKLAWKKEKGLDTTGAQDDFDRALMMCKSDDSPARPLIIGSTTGERFIDERNLPDTGYGS